MLCNQFQYHKIVSVSIRCRMCRFNTRADVSGVRTGLTTIILCIVERTIASAPSATETSLKLLIDNDDCTMIRWPRGLSQCLARIIRCTDKDEREYNKFTKKKLVSFAMLRSLRSAFSKHICSPSISRIGLIILFEVPTMLWDIFQSVFCPFLLLSQIAQM